MFSAHLVFADVNKHSRLGFSRRADQLERFWEVCNRSKPPGLNKESSFSFYETDNDSLMAGFSNVPGMVSKEQVLAWTSSLYHELRHNGIDLSFGVCVESPTEWKVDVGFLDDVRRLYVADDTYHKFGYAPRSRVIGDPLIVVARLLELAKRTQFPIAFADSIGGDRCDDRLTRCLQRHGSIEIANLSALLDTLGPEKKEWLRRKNIKPYGIRFHTV